MGEQFHADIYARLKRAGNIPMYFEGDVTVQTSLTSEGVRLTASTLDGVEAVHIVPWIKIEYATWDPIPPARRGLIQLLVSEMYNGL